MALTDFPPRVNLVTTTIAASAAATGEVDLFGTVICGIFLPAGFQSANLTFLAGPVSGDLRELRDVLGGAVTAAASANTYLALDPNPFFGVRFLKVQSSVTQSAERVLQLAVRPL